MRLPSRLSRLHPNIWVLSAASFLTDISSEMLLNLLPLFLFNVLGARTTVIGLIEGVAETTASIVKLYSGTLSDRLKMRKRLVVGGYSLSTLVKPLLYFANTWLWVLVVRFGDRVGKGIRQAPRDALLAASVEPERRGLAFGLHRAGDTAGAFTGLAIASLIIWYSQSSSTLLTRQTFQAVVLASIIPAALAVIILAKGVREVSSFSVNASSPKFSLAGYDRRFVAFLASIILFTLGNSSDAFIILRGQERGLNVIQVMGMLLSFTAVYSLLSGPIGSFSDRVGRKKLVLSGWVIYCLIYLGLAIAQSGFQVWLLFIGYGVYYAFTEGVARALVADLVPPTQRGTAYGIYHAAVGLTALPASLIAGLLWQGIGSWSGFGASAPFYFGSLMAFLAGIVFLTKVS